MELKELVDYLSAYLDSSLFKDYCPNGLQIEGKKEIKKIATAVSANLQTIEKAARDKVDVLIVHHGLFWNRDPYPIVGAKQKKIRVLLEQDISLLAYHLPLDAHQEVGNNWRAASDLGWQNLEPCGCINEIPIGVKGTFAPLMIESFVAELEAYYQHGAVVALAGKRNVQSALLISGGAYSEVAKAAQEGVDCFITGNFDEPAWGMAHEEKIHFLALGHSATERIGPKALADQIAHQFGLSCCFIDIPNPF